MQERQLPQVLTKEHKTKIQSLLESGLDPEIDAIEIADSIGIPLDHLKKLMREERQDLLLRKAELTSKELLEIDLDQKNLEAKYGKARIALLKLKQAESQFLRESLGKDLGYSKRTEVTGANGGALVVKAVVFNAPIIPKPPEVVHEHI